MNLIEAVKLNDIQKVQSLLDLGVNVNEQEDIIKWTPLHYASYVNNYELTKLLLQYGANINIKNIFKITPLHTGFRCKEVLTL